LLKEQIEVVLRENAILKRAVAIQHDRQKEQEERNQEVQHLRQMVSQYQEQVRTLEVSDPFLFLKIVRFFVYPSKMSELEKQTNFSSFLYSIREEKEGKVGWLADYFEEEWK
jgi:hypothetical protein